MSNKKHWNCGKKLVGSPFILLNRILLKVFQSSYILNNLSSNWVKFYFLICFNIIKCNYFLKCIYLPLESFKALVFLKYTGWVKKVWLAAPGAKFYFFVQISCMVFFQYFLEIFNFLGYLYGPKKSPRTWFLSKSKVQKSNNVYIYYFYQILKFYKYCMKESQKICQTVVRKFAIFCSG